MGKAFERQTKAIEDQAIKRHGKEIIESNEVIKNDFNIDRSGASHEKQRGIFDKLLPKRDSEFDNKKICVTHID